MTKLHDVRMAISADFLKAFSEIPSGKQKKVREFVDKFQHNPAGSGINYEKIHAGNDPNLRSVRIDREYRAILLKPEMDNLYMLLWVAKHDDAYEWATRRRLAIHPETGGLQVVMVSEKTAEISAPEKNIQRLFEGIKDRQLRRLGVPDDLLASVRALTCEAELDAMELRLPQEAYECLFLLQSGFSYEDVVREYERDQEKVVDVSDFRKALDNPDSQRRFKVIDDALELQELLNAPLEQWRVFLHPMQRRYVEMKANGPVRILGGAGTGKTVVAMHRANWLAKYAFIKPQERILFTTFTKNLAADIQQALRSICSAEDLTRIEVVNLDAWVSRYMKKSGYDAVVDYTGNKWQPLWEDALNFKPTDSELSDAFYREEWEQIIQAQGIADVQGYYKASRVGRGRRLNRRMRKAVWPVFEEYRALLNEHNVREVEDAYRECSQLLQEQGDVLGYKAILVDEAQDFSAQAFRLIRQMVPEGPNDLFIVGDAHQRIYGRPVVMGQCGINIQGRGRKLRINYRTTDETRRFATAVLRDIPFDDLDGGEDNNSGYKSLTHGPKPEVKTFETALEEGEYILSVIQSLKSEQVRLETICITCRTGKLVEQYADLLKQHDVACHVIHHRTTDDPGRPGVRIATMHRVKGIEFDHVIIASANKGVIPLAKAVIAQDNQLADRQAEARERALFYVALTRSRKTSTITAYGDPSPFLLV